MVGADKTTELWRPPCKMVFTPPYNLLQNFGETFVCVYLPNNYLRISGQFYKASMIVMYDSRVIPDLKIPHIMTLES